jgi:hypothetical protein
LRGGGDAPLQRRLVLRDGRAARERAQLGGRGGEAAA